MEWNEETAEKIVQKHKSRFSLKFTLKIIRVLVAVLLLFAVYKMGISILYEQSEAGERTELYQKLAIDWMSPELSSSFGHTKEISVLLTEEVSFPVEQRIGKKDYIVSQLTVRKPLLTKFTTVEMDRLASYDAQDDGFYFDLPYDPRTGDSLESTEEATQVWQTLEMLHEGNVANLAFSTADYYSPKEIITLLSSYDVDVLWMPLYMGEFKRFTEGGWSGGEGSMALSPQWGLNGGREMDKNGGHLIRILDEETIVESELIMLKNMESMLKKDKKLAEKLLNTTYLQERVDYLNDEGFQAYGAVVTGPVKELLKLQQLEEIRNIQLGEVRQWNWSE